MLHCPILGSARCDRFTSELPLCYLFRSSSSHMIRVAPESENAKHSNISLPGGLDPGDIPIDTQVYLDHGPRA